MHDPIALPQGQLFLVLVVFLNKIYYTESRFRKKMNMGEICFKLEKSRKHCCKMLSLKETNVMHA